MLEGFEWVGGGDGGDGILGRGDWKKFPHARASGTRRIMRTPINERDNHTLHRLQVQASNLAGQSKNGKKPDDIYEPANCKL